MLKPLRKRLTRGAKRFFSSWIGQLLIHILGTGLLQTVGSAQIHIDFSRLILLEVDGFEFSWNRD